MALIVVFQRTHREERNGSDVADYAVDVYVNREKIANATVKGHDRGTGWKGLVRDLVKVLKKK